MRSRSRGKRLVTVVAACLAAVMIATAGAVWYRAHNARVPLLSDVVYIDGGGEVRGHGPDSAPLALADGTRVAIGDGVSNPASAALSTQRSWLAGSTLLPNSSAYASLLRYALVDLRTLTLPGGAAVSAWAPAWRYVWPRDAAFVAAAMAEDGHTQEALQVLVFLQRIQPATGVFRARYLPDGSGVPDARGEESDADGLVLWAVDRLIRRLPTLEAKRSALSRVRPLVDRSVAAILRLTDTPSNLPPPSMDYWEVPSTRLTLGTAAPMAVGLEAAGNLYLTLGDASAADTCAARAEKVRDAIERQFAPRGYSRYADGGGRDASIAYLLPPFTESVQPDVLRAWTLAASEMARPAGGLAPGADWKDDGISWTPETALFALTAASVGDPARATGWLDWIQGHLTSYGAVPEKVLSDGSDAGPAPLSWTDALVVLAISALQRSRT